MSTSDHKRQDAGLLTEDRPSVRGYSHIEDPREAGMSGPAAAVPPHRPASRRWLWSTAIIAVLAAGSAVTVIEWPHAGPAPRAAAQGSVAQAAVPVSVAIVEQRNTAIWTTFSGRLEAVNRVDIRPRASGAIMAASFREGALVKQGDLLFTIDPAPYTAEVQRLEGQLAAAQARLVLAAREQQRGFQLGGTNDLAQNLIDQRVNEFRAAEANLRSTQAQIDTARLNLSYTEVRAPISGRVGKIEVTAGNLVPAGNTAPVLTTLVSVDPIYASFDADEQTVARALASLPASGDVQSQIGLIPVQMGTLTTEGTPFTGKLQLIDNLVDARSGTVRVRAVFDNPGGKLLPGQFARLQLGQAKTEATLAVDERAIGTDQDHRYVLVVGADDKAAYRQVELGGGAGGLRIVKAGLQPGERVIVRGLQRVRPGALTAPQVVPMTTDAELVTAAH